MRKEVCKLCEIIWTRWWRTCYNFRLLFFQCFVCSLGFGFGSSRSTSGGWRGVPTRCENFLEPLIDHDFVTLLIFLLFVTAAAVVAA